MIDTLRLRVPEVIVQPDADVSFVPSAVNNRTGEPVIENVLYSLPDGKPVAGSKAYHNGELVNVDFHGGAAMIQVSLPKAHNGRDNTFPISRAEAEQVIDRTFSYLNERGILVSPDKAELSRVDTFKNIHAEHPFECYSALFGLMSGKRMQKVDYGTTYNFRNSQREVDIYDKQAEIESRGATAPDGLADNTMRIEYRAKNGKRARADFGEGGVQALLMRWDDLPEIYRAKMGEMLFKVDVSAGVEMLQRVEVSRMNYFSDTYGRNWFGHYVKHLGYTTLGGLFGNLDSLKRALLTSGKDRDTAQRCIREVEQAVLMNPVIDAHGVDPKGLYDELYRKVMAA